MKVPLNLLLVLSGEGALFSPLAPQSINRCEDGAGDLIVAAEEPVGEGQ